MIVKNQNILIVRTDRIGDLILTLPMAGIIKKNLPGCKLSFMVGEYTKTIVKNHKYIDNILVLKEEKGKIPFFQNLKEIKKYNFDTCLVVFPTFKVALMMLLAGISTRVGTGYRWYSFLFNKKIFQHRKNAEHHELEYNINLLSKIGIEEKVNPENVKYDIIINKECEQKIIQLLYDNDIKLDKPIVIIHPGSGGSAVDLPISKFKQLVILMAQELNIQMIVTGSKEERKICEELLVHPAVKNFAGLLNLEEFIALIAKTELLIGNSSGPIHIAAALNKFVIGFYPKIVACSPERWGPYTEKKVVFSPKIDCTNCSKEQCKQLNCMDSIETKEVFENIKNILHYSVMEK